MYSLSTGSSLQDGKYIVKSKVSQEGLSITYKAVQTSLNRVVIVKEFYMRDFCSREKDSNKVIVGNSYAEQVDAFKVKFLSDAKSNASGESESDIKIFDVFEENNTAYYVFLGNEDVVIDEQKEYEIEVIVEQTQISSDNTNSKDDDSTTLELKVDDIEVIESPNDNTEGSKRESFVKKHKRTIFSCLGLIALGFICASIAIYIKSNSSSSSDELTELSDTLVTDEEVAIDTLVYDNDMQGEKQSNSSQQEFEEYINLSNEWLEKSKKNLHKPSNVQNILNARYYYYDKADKINYSLKNERLPSHKEIDDITEQEYQYWVKEAKKLGSAKSKYELKRTYLQRAKSLAFKHQNLLDSQIKWLDEQLAKRTRKRH